MNTKYSMEETVLDPSLRLRPVKWSDLEAVMGALPATRNFSMSTNMYGFEPMVMFTRTSKDVGLEHLYYA